MSEIVTVDGVMATRAKLKATPAVGTLVTEDGPDTSTVFPVCKRK